MKRADVLARIAGLLRQQHDGDCLLVGIDGVDGAGKTIFADELGETVRSGGREVVRISVDDFHRPRAERYRLGVESAEGYWLDAFDYARLITDVLIPLGPGGDRCYRAASHDLGCDQPLDPPWQIAPRAAAVIVDGMFLQWDELLGRWDLMVYLDVPFDVTGARMLARDGTLERRERYLGACRHYLDECDPLGHADVVVDNTDPIEPTIRVR